MSRKKYSLIIILVLSFFALKGFWFLVFLLSIIRLIN